MERSSVTRHGFPLAQPPRFAVLRAFCVVSEGADVLIPVFPIPSAACAAAKCVAAVLGDAQRRLSVMGGREGMPRSLGSVLGCLVARFVGGGNICRVAAEMPSVHSLSNGIAICRDGATLLATDARGGSHGVHVFNLHTGARVRIVGSQGTGPLQFTYPVQVWVASDDFVFVADADNHRIQILTPRDFDFHGFVGEGQLCHPHGVCADDDIIVVSEDTYRISAFNRCDRALLRRFGSYGRGDGQLEYPRGLCLIRRNCCIAVADHNNHRVCVFSVDGELICHVGVGVLRHPTGVACSAFDELVVADSGNNRVVVFSASGELVRTMDGGAFFGVAVHGGTVFAHTWNYSCKCVMFT
jgi:DNA-binding beta-propeller fold protein YncE